MSAWMYQTGAHVQADAERCQMWLERAVDKGYAPAMNDLAVILLGEADSVEEAHPEVKADVKANSGGGSAGRGVHRRGNSEVSREGLRVGAWEEKTEAGEERREMEEDEGDEGDGGEEGEEGSRLPPEQARLFEQVMARRKRSMQLLQAAAKTGNTDAMTNLGNMQEAMGYFDDARNWYRYVLILLAA